VQNGSETDDGSSPIAPPTSIIDSRALDQDVDVNEPVSGSGNPALIGSSLSEPSTEECNSERDPSACPRR
jgi:hypothetical protein